MDLRLVEAARTGNVEYLQRLIGEDPLLLEAVGLGGAETPLHVASLCGHLDFVKKVFELKPQFAHELNQDGYTPLHLASVNGHVEIVVELLKLGNDLCIIQGKELRIALHFAVVKGRTHVIKELLSSRPDSVEMKTAGGETALHLAVKNNQFGSLRLLVEYLIQMKMETVLNEKDNQGNTILHLAVLRKQYEVLDLLLSDGAATKGVMEVNSENQSGLMPLDVLLQFQSEAGDLEMEATLLKAGAIRSRGVSSSVEPSRFASRSEELEDFFKYKRGRDKPSDVRTALLTVAALILTATYQAALSPPSGLWQDDGSGSGSAVTPQQNAGTSSISPSPQSSPGQENNSDENHLAGKSILASRNLVSFGWFVFGNSIGFYTASSTIVFLTQGFPLQLELQVSMFAMVTTYISAMYGIIPDGKTTVVFIVFSVFLIFLPNIYKQMRDRYYRKKYSINVNP